ncbi:MAG: type II secretion system protein [Planctomycetes bacterium]|nr:type II secretion system protein [Planctomycetota bacterium]
MLIVISILSILMVVLVTNLGGGTDKALELKATSLINDLSTQIKMYQMSYNYYPKSQTSEPWKSSYLAFALGTKGPRSKPFFTFKEEQVTKWPIENDECCDIRNPASAGDTIKYRNNQMDEISSGDTTSFSPPVKMVDEFDLWCKNAKGNETGINNW